MISFCTWIKLRTYQLREVIETNLRNLGDNEWVIVDCNLPGEDPDLDELLDRFKGDSRLRVIKEPQEHVHMSRLKNLAHAYARGDILVNLDADNAIGDKFVETIERECLEGTVVHAWLGQWTDGTCGRIAIHRTDFEALGGYDEALGPIGYDDLDLLHRAKAMQLHFETITDPAVVGWAIKNTHDDSMVHIDPAITTRYNDMNAANHVMSEDNIKAGRLKANQATDNTTRAIVVFVHGEQFETQFAISRPFIEAYADKCNAELVVLTGRSDAEHPEHDKFQAYEAFKRFDRSLYVDVDSIIRPDTPDIFKLHPPGFIYGVDEIPITSMTSGFWGYVQPDVVRASQRLPGNETTLMMNGGLFLIDKELADFYRPPEYPFPDNCPGAEQTLFSVRMQEAGNVFKPLDPVWNLTWNSSVFADKRDQAYIVHFNFKPVDARLREMGSEVAKIRNLKPESSQEFSTTKHGLTVSVHHVPDNYNYAMSLLEQAWCDVPVGGDLAGAGSLPIARRFASLKGLTLNSRDAEQWTIVKEVDYGCGQ